MSSAFALAGFLAGYRGLTREAYALTCASSPPGAGPLRFLFAVRRADAAPGSAATEFIASVTGLLISDTSSSPVRVQRS